MAKRDNGDMLAKVVAPPGEVDMLAPLGASRASPSAAAATVTVTAPERVKNAIESFLRGCASEVHLRNGPTAQSHLDMAVKRIKVLGEQPLRRRMEEEARMLQVNILMLPLFAAPAPAFKLRFYCYTRESLGARCFQSYHTLCRTMRSQCFCKELNIPAAMEFDEKEGVAVHALALVGDSPCGYARCWIEQGRLPPDAAPGAAPARWAVLDRMLSIKTRRERGCANYLLQNLSQYIWQNDVGLLVAHVHCRNHRVVEKLLQKGFKFLLSMEEYAKTKDDAPIIYHDGTRMRINTVHLYHVLNNGAEAQVADALLQARACARWQVDVGLRPENRQKTEQVVREARQRKERAERLKKEQEDICKRAEAEGPAQKELSSQEWQQKQNELLQLTQEQERLGQS